MSKAYPFHKWVAYTEKLNRTEIGVYERYAEIVGDHAYVRPDSQGSKADIVPAANVFETKDEALAYLAGTGVKKWVVFSGDWRDKEPCLLPFQGLVTYCMTQRHGKFNRISATVRISDGKVFSSYNELEVFNTKKEAEKYHTEVWRRRIKRVKEAFSEGHALLNAMYANAPRTRKKAR